MIWLIVPDHLPEIASVNLLPANWACNEPIMADAGLMRLIGLLRSWVRKSCHTARTQQRANGSCGWLSWSF
jgi:hypothetical protein